MACSTEYALMLAAATAFAAASAALVVEIGSVAAITSGAAFVRAREDVARCLRHSGMFNQAERTHDETQRLGQELDDLRARAGV